MAVGCINLAENGKAAAAAAAFCRKEAKREDLTIAFLGGGRCKASGDKQGVR